METETETEEETEMERVYVAADQEIVISRSTGAEKEPQWFSSCSAEF